MNLPIKIKTYVSAICEAMEYSLLVDFPVYVFRVNEGGYVIDRNAEVYSNEVLIIKIFKGHAE